MRKCCLQLFSLQKLQLKKVEGREKENDLSTSTCPRLPLPFHLVAKNASVENRECLKSSLYYKGFSSLGHATTLSLYFSFHR